MSAWDPSFVDPTARDSGGYILRAAGTRSGPMTLENGASITFPWKRQQQLGLTPAEIDVREEASFGDVLFLNLTGPKLSPGAPSNTNTAVLQLGSDFAGTFNRGHLQLHSPDGTKYGSVGGNAYNTGLVMELRSTDVVDINVPGTSLTMAKDGGANPGLTLDTFVINKAWYTFSPTITQGAVTLIYTNHYSRYVKIGRTVHWSFILTFTSAGTANPIIIDLPFDAAGFGGNRAIGPGYLYPNGAPSIFGQFLLHNSLTYMVFGIPAGYYGTALTTNHVLTGTVTYETAA